MASSVSRTWSKAGTLPGQRIEVTVSFVKRVENKVTFSYSVKAKSLGNDQFRYNERHNKLTIKVGDAKAVLKYQLIGTGTVITDNNTRSDDKPKGTIVAEVSNTTTSLDVTVKNERIWVDAPNDAWNPRTTGVIDPAEKVGTITFPARAKKTLTFNKGYNVSSSTTPGTSISNVHDDITKYEGESVTVGKCYAKDNSNCYIPAGGYSTSNEYPINLYSSSRTDMLATPRTFDLSKDLTYYVVWKPNTFIYKFNYTGVDDKKYIYSRTKPSAPSIDIDNGKKGHELQYWYTSGGSKTYKPGNKISETRKTTETINFYPNWKAISSNIKLDFNCSISEISDGFKNNVLKNNIIRSIPYTYGETFNFNSTTLFSSPSYTATDIRPGYKLVGWTYGKYSTPYLPGTAKPTYTLGDSTQTIVRSKDSNSSFKKDGLTLYAVWEYYSSVYVYTSEHATEKQPSDGWKVVVPYIYSNGSWHICNTYVYTDKKDNVPRWTG